MACARFVVVVIFAKERLQRKQHKPAKEIEKEDIRK